MTTATFIGAIPSMRKSWNRQAQQKSFMVYKSKAQQHFHVLLLNPALTHCHLSLEWKAALHVHKGQYSTMVTEA